MLLASLTAAPRTRHQLAGKLADREVPDDVAARLLDRLEQVGLIDDAAYARSWAVARHNSRGLSASAIRRELTQRGVDADLIDAALAELTVEQEQDRALDLAVRKAATLRGLDPQVRLRRLAGMLARRGYSPALAFSAARAALAEDQALLDLDGEE